MFRTAITAVAGAALSACVATAPTIGSPEAKTAATGSAGGAFVYGSFAGGEGAFYPADSTGKMIPGALPTTEDISVPSYTPTSVPASPTMMLALTSPPARATVSRKMVGSGF